MSFDISAFRSQGLTGAGARPNLFDMTLSGTGASTHGVNTNNFVYLCKIASIPPSTMGVVEVPYFGRMVKVPGNRTFDNLSLTIINDEDFAIRNGFEKWMNSMNSHIANKSVNPSDLYAQLELKQYKRDQNPSDGGTWIFHTCFPVALGEIGLDWGSNDAVEEFTVDFAYDYWAHGSITS